MPDRPADISSADLPSGAYGNAPDAALHHISREARQLDPTMSLSEVDLIEDDLDGDLLGPNARAVIESDDTWWWDDPAADWEGGAERGTAHHDNPHGHDISYASQVVEFMASQSTDGVVGLGIGTERTLGSIDTQAAETQRNAPGPKNPGTHNTNDKWKR